MMMVLVVVVVVVMMAVARAQFRQFHDDREQQGQADIPQAFLGYRHDGGTSRCRRRECFRSRSVHRTVQGGARGPDDQPERT